MFDKIWKCLLLLVLAAGVCMGLVQARYTLVPVNPSVVVEYDRITGHTRVGQIDQGRDATGKDYGDVVWLEPLPPRRGVAR